MFVCELSGSGFESSCSHLNWKLLFLISLHFFLFLYAVILIILATFLLTTFTSNSRKLSFILQKNCQLIVSDKSTLLRKVHFLLKEGFHFIAFSFLLEVRHLVTIVINFVYKWARQLFWGHYKLMSDWFMFLEYFFD